jgi:DmsE family decaheme c-type cytochrome
MSQSPRFRCTSGGRLRIAALLLMAMFACTATAMAGQSDQPAPVAAPPGTYAKDAVQTCLRQCHNKQPIDLILQTPHGVKADTRTPFAQHQCETCHGPSPEHIAVTSNLVGVVYKGPKKSPVAQRNATCLSCHASGLRTHWTGSQHETRGVACTDCHNIHASEQKVLSKATQAEVCFTCHKEQRAQTRRISTHPLAVTSLASTAKMACADCHNPHGSTGPTLLIKNSVNETCYTCHAEKRGPFLWDHAPVVENCTNCHTPHGSSNAPLLKTRAPYLCQECHSGDHAAQINSGANLAGGNVTTVNGTQQPGAAAPRVQMGARACLNCHVLVHGSNHPAGAKFQR